MPDGIDDDSVDENTEDVFDLDLRRTKESDPWVKELCARGSYTVFDADWEQFGNDSK